MFIPDDEGEVKPLNERASELLSLNMGETMSNVGAIYGIMTAFAYSEQAEGWAKTVDGKEYNAQEYYEYVNQQIAAAAVGEKEGAEKIPDILAALGQFGSFVQDEGGMTLVRTSVMCFRSFFCASSPSTWWSWSKAGISMTSVVKSSPFLR